MEQRERYREGGGWSSVGSQPPFCSFLAELSEEGDGTEKNNNGGRGD